MIYQRSIRYEPGTIDFRRFTPSRENASPRALGGRAQRPVPPPRQVVCHGYRRRVLYQPSIVLIHRWQRISGGAAVPARQGPRKRRLLRELELRRRADVGEKAVDLLRQHLGLRRQFAGGTEHLIGGDAGGTGRLLDADDIR